MIGSPQSPRAAALLRWFAIFALVAAIALLGGWRSAGASDVSGNSLAARTIKTSRDRRTRTHPHHTQLT